MKKSIVASACLAALITAQLVHSATFVATQSGDWLDPATWGGAVPGYSDDRVIPSGITVRVSLFSDIHAAGTTQVFGTLNVFRNGLYNEGLIENHNELFVTFGGFFYMQPGATLVNRSRMFCGYACRFYSGTVINESGAVMDNTDELQTGFDGTLVNAGVLRNAGPIFYLTASPGFSTSGQFINMPGGTAVLDDVDNYGDFDNQGTMTLGRLENHSNGPYVVVRNSGTMNAVGVLTNRSGSRVQNDAQWNGKNGGGIINDVDGSVTAAFGTMQFGDASTAYSLQNHGFFTVYATAIFERGGFSNDGSLFFGGLLRNRAQLFNDGSIGGFGGLFQNDGYLRNNRSVSGGLGTITNNGTIDNFLSFLFETFTNNGVFQNFGSLSGGLTNTINNGSIHLYCGSNFYPGDNGLIGNAPIDHCQQPTIEWLITNAQGYGVNAAVLGQAVALRDDPNFRNNVAVCNKLDAFGNQMRASRTMDPSVFNYLTGLLAQTRAYIGCPP